MHSHATGDQPFPPHPRVLIHYIYRFVFNYSTPISFLIIFSDFLKSNFYGSVHRKYIPIYVQQDATLHTLFYLETALHVSGGTSTHHQERKQLYLQHVVFVTSLLLPAAIVEEFQLAGSSFQI